MAAFGQMAYTLPLMLLAQQADWSDPRNLFLGRIAFATVQLVTTIVNIYIHQVWHMRPHASGPAGAGNHSSLHPPTPTPSPYALRIGPHCY